MYVCMMIGYNLLPNKSSTNYVVKANSPICVMSKVCQKFAMPKLPGMETDFKLRLRNIVHTGNLPSIEKKRK